MGKDDTSREEEDAQDRETAEDYQRRLAHHIANSRGAWHKKWRQGLIYQAGGPDKERDEPQKEGS